MRREPAASPMCALIEFDGTVSVHTASGAVGLSLRGETAPIAPLTGAAAAEAGASAARRRAVELLFSGVALLEPALPPSLHGVRLFELDAASSVLPTRRSNAAVERLFRIEAQEGRYTVRARGLQRQAGASQAFFAVLPRPRVGPLRRWGWSLLLSLLRLPPLARLIGGRRPQPVGRSLR